MNRDDASGGHEGTPRRMTVGEANRCRACIDCGKPGANLLTDRTERILRICDACLRKDDWHRFGLRDRGPIVGEVPTEFVGGEWRWPTHDSDPVAVVTYATEPSPETGHVGWCWWALGAMGDAPNYEAACAAAVAEVQRRMDNRIGVM